MNTNLKAATNALKTPKKEKNKTYSSHTTTQQIQNISKAEQHNSFGDRQYMNILTYKILTQIAIKSKNKRKKLLLSQRMLAKRASLSQSTISRMEFGNGNTSINSLFKIINALELNIELKDSI